MKNIFSPIWFILFISFLSSCMRERPSEEQIKTFRSVKSVKIIVNQSYDFDGDVYLPYKEIAQKLFKSIGLKIVYTDTADSHLTLTIYSTGKAISKWYEYRDQISPKKKQGRGLHYTGAEITGILSLSYNELPVFRKSFSSKKEPPLKIYSKSVSEYRDPSSAPFETTFRMSGSFISKLFELASDIWGHEILIPFLDKETHIEFGHETTTYLGYQDRAVEIFAKIGKPAIGSLIKALHNENSDISSNASRSLKLIGKPAVDTLLVTMSDKNPIIRARAAYTLGSIKDRRSFKFLCAGLKDEYSDVRAASAIALGLTKNKEALKYLCTGLMDESPNVRSASAKAMGLLKDSRAVEPLISAVQKETDSNIRWVFLESLAEIGKPALKPLIRILEDKESHILYDVAEILNQMEWFPENYIQKYNYYLVLGWDESLSRLGRPAIEDLIESLRSNEELNSKVELKRKTAARALKRICGKDFGDDYKSWSVWWNQNKDTF